MNRPALGQSGDWRVVIGLLLLAPVLPLVVWGLWLTGGMEGLIWAAFIAWVCLVFWLFD